MGETVSIALTGFARTLFAVCESDGQGRSAILAD